MKTLRRPPRPEPVTSDLKIVEIGGKKVLANPSNSTETSVATDFALVQNQLSQISAIAQQKKADGLQYEPSVIRRDFSGKRVLDFAYDKDLEAATNNQNASSIAAEMIARTIGRSPKTVLQYAKRLRVGGKNQRKVILRRRRK
jgi:hypothetical protein